MQIDRQKFQQTNVEIHRDGGALPKPVKPAQDRTDAKKSEPRKLHPKAYENAERWDGMS